jgi:hypothetical protein
MTVSSNMSSASLPNGLKLKKLTAEQIEQIDEFIASLGDYGEVHLVIQHGELRYINKMESHKAWNDKAGNSP